VGEITEALRRAKLQRDSHRETDPSAERPPRESTVIRAGLDVPPPAERAVPDAIPIDEVAEEDVEIAPIPRTRSGPWPARVVLLDPRQPHTERFRRFALRVRQGLKRHEMKSVLITSPVRSEGKTFTACNLALALASMAAGGRIALLELDVRRPAVSQGLGVDPRVGIEEVLTGAAALGAARIRTELPSLDLYLVREPPAQAHEILALSSLEAVFCELGTRYDAVVVDAPPVLLVPDVSLILGHVDACVAVVRAGRSRLKAAREMFEQLPREKLLGVFVNDIGTPRRSEQYGYYSAKDEPQ
jgi:capsular exopolysaccharide synthesis family protein